MIAAPPRAVEAATALWVSVFNYAAAHGVTLTPGTKAAR
jgi:hypothetical protein